MIKNNIRKLREKRGLRQEDIANAVGMPKSLVSMIENGRGVFTRQELMVAAKLMDCLESDLYPNEVLAGLYGIETNGEKVEKQKRPYFTVSIPDVFAEALDRIAQIERHGNRRDAAIALIREGVYKRNWGL